MKKNSNFQTGFTLIEMLVVIFIVAMIGTASIVNFRQGEKQKQVVIAFDTVSNALRVAQNYSLSGRGTNNANPACRTPQYYYVTITYTTTVTISALNNNVAGCGSTPDVMDTYNLPPNTRIRASGLVFNGVPASTSMVVAFYPPFGAIKASRDGGALSIFTTATATVESVNSTISKVLTVSGVSGKIGE